MAYYTIYGSKGILWLTDPNCFTGQVRFQPVRGGQGNGSASGSGNAQSKRQ